MLSIYSFFLFLAHTFSLSLYFSLFLLLPVEHSIPRNAFTLARARAYTRSHPPTHTYTFFLPHSLLFQPPPPFSISHQITPSIFFSSKSSFSFPLFFERFICLHVYSRQLISLLFPFLCSRQLPCPSPALFLPYPPFLCHLLSPPLIPSTPSRPPCLLSPLAFLASVGACSCQGWSRSHPNPGSIAPSFVNSDQPSLDNSPACNLGDCMACLCRYRGFGQGGRMPPRPTVSNIKVF